ncbi:helix-turn-helix domain-containing protein [Actinoplanes sp. G11-F43]|uniref:TetR/AcrR family transcriptional regulator n=1 Tax=Actinoplanes sp. G11-F43 TaxID=3424130 RepID=UPI003D33FAE2
MAHVTKHDLRSAATRERLVAVARQLFADHGYAEVGTEQIVRTAGLTRGALYHQFRNKEDLFAAVAEAVEAEVVEQVTARLDGADEEDQGAGRMLAGAHEFMVVCARPDVRRILHEAPTVLGAAAWRELSARYGLGLIETALRTVTPEPPAALAPMLMGALDEATRYIAAAGDPEAARRECLEVLRQMIAGLRPA